MTANAKMALGAAAVLLILLGGCGAVQTPGQGQNTPGSISGAVTLENVQSQPGSTAGWQVVVGGSYMTTVTATGEFMVANVPPGTYNVQVVTPSRPDVVYACAQPGCSLTGIKVFAGTKTVNANFAVYELPAPPF